MCLGIIEQIRILFVILLVLSFKNREFRLKSLNDLSFAIEFIFKALHSYQRLAVLSFDLGQLIYKRINFIFMTGCQSLQFGFNRLLELIKFLLVT